MALILLIDFIDRISSNVFAKIQSKPHTHKQNKSTGNLMG